MGIITRLSLYKLLLPTTVWILVSYNEYSLIRDWLISHSYLSTKRTSLDNLTDTFLWFRAKDEAGVWVACGHIRRLQKELDVRFPHAGVSECISQMRGLQTAERPRRNGAQILALMIQQAREENR